LGATAAIHGELLKLGINVGQTTVAKYMARGRPTSVAGMEGVSSHPNAEWIARQLTEAFGWEDAP
jgi:hypothetical protein